MTNVDANPTIEISTSVLDIVGPKLEAITDLLHSATKAAAKPAFWEGEKDQLLPKVTALVFEILYTVKALVAKLGLCKSPPGSPLLPDLPSAYPAMPFANIDLQLFSLSTSALCSSLLVVSFAAWTSLLTVS